MLKRFLECIADIIVCVVTFTALLFVFFLVEALIYRLVFSDRNVIAGGWAILIVFSPFVLSALCTAMMQKRRKITRNTRYESDSIKPLCLKTITSVQSNNALAQSLLDSIAFHCDEINSATTVFDFWYSWEKLEGNVSELIRLNEKKRVKMQPPPRKEWKRIQSNLENTINEFLDRATRYIPTYGKLRADAIENLLEEIEDNTRFYSLFLPENKSRLELLRFEAISIRQQIAEQEMQDTEQKRKDFNLQRFGLDDHIDVSDIDPFRVADSLEAKLKALHEWTIVNGASTEDSLNAFSNFKYACASSKLPLAAEIRLDDLLTKYESKFTEAGTLHAIDNMSGYEFEHWCADLLRKIGFTKVEVTQGSGDQGVDILAVKDGIKYAIQCKCYSKNLDNTPVQEVNSGKAMPQYRCQIGAVITNRYFTQSAQELAEWNGVLLWDRDWIAKALEQIQKQ